MKYFVSLKSAVSFKISNFKVSVSPGISTFLCCVSGFLAFSPSTVSALPWDVDMYSQQSLQYTEIARAPVKGTVPVGYKPFTMTIEEADGVLQNPVPLTDESLWRGKRLWAAQCSSCHGISGESATKIGGLLGAPDLLEDRFKTYSPGRVYATIVWGIRSMPRYGYKLSEGERWDIVNYLRFLQGVERGTGLIERPVSSKTR
ncbi:MAG TPA: c-type cytochrome [Oligoflexia bacterium]|nr:c-type cytochrome [Oligoflexia bacterium]HMP49072.1 c-type cytochrome [Oligoflexia bacterium]